MLGAVCGDIIGSYFEFNRTKDYNFIFHNRSRFTDDTVLTAAVCDALLSCGHKMKVYFFKAWAVNFAEKYKKYYSLYPNAGYGGMFSEWAESPNIYKQNSYGNGASMRVSPIGYAFDTLDKTQLAVTASCYYTHNNKEAIIGAKAVASAVFLAYRGKSKDEIKNYIKQNFGYDLSFSLDSIRENYKFTSRTLYSVPQSIVAFLESRDYEDAVRKAISLGGDTDTMACIAGGIAEAYYKEIPDHILDFCLNKLDDRFIKTMRDFYLKFCPVMLPKRLT